MVVTGAAQISDATFTSTGGFQPIHERQVMVGLTAHVTPQTDVYVFAGGEFASANYSFVNFGGGNALRHRRALFLRIWQPGLQQYRL